MPSGKEGGVGDGRPSRNRWTLHSGPLLLSRILQGAAGTRAGLPAARHVRQLASEASGQRAD
eukprot:5632504-Pyramimonas_sp.AAC.1